jgi:hypothetical protein
MADGDFGFRFQLLCPHEPRLRTRLRWACCTSNRNVHANSVRIHFRAFSASICKEVRNKRLGSCRDFVVRLGVAVRVGRKLCDRSSSSRDSCRLEHLRRIHVALRIANIPICEPHRGNDFASWKE